MEIAPLTVVACCLLHGLLVNSLLTFQVLSRSERASGRHVFVGTNELTFSQTLFVRTIVIPAFGPADGTTADSY